MKILIIFIALLISACSSVPKVIVDVPPIQPSQSIMLDCDPFNKPKEYTFDEFKVLLVENYEIFKLCNDLNTAKKQFILKNILKNP